VDKDGEISKSEMKAYFIRVNLQSSMEFRRGFKHNFRECTFLTPTTCQHCQKVLWGLIRQGFKCKDCGVPVHGACKDSAVLECTSRKPSWMLGARENGNAINPRRRLFLNISTSLIQPVLQFDWFNGGAPFLERGVSLRRSKPSNRLRTVSNTSTPSPEPRAECSASASSHARSTILNKMSMRLSNSSTSSSKHKTRARSETVDCYRCTSPECDIVPSLACEEVFEDESTSMNNDQEHSESRQQQLG